MLPVPENSFLAIRKKSYGWIMEHRNWLNGSGFRQMSGKYEKAVLQLMKTAFFLSFKFSHRYKFFLPLLHKLFVRKLSKRFDVL